MRQESERRMYGQAKGALEQVEGHQPTTRKIYAIDSPHTPELGSNPNHTKAGEEGELHTTSGDQEVQDGEDEAPGEEEEEAIQLFAVGEEERRPKTGT